jgi:hypothetical protein
MLSVAALQSICDARACGPHALGMPGRRFLPRPSTTCASARRSTPLTLRQRIASRTVPGMDEVRPGGRADRAMDVLQYGMAGLAIAVALLLAALR